MSTNSTEWFVGQNKVGQTPSYVVELAFARWADAFEALRALYLCDLWDQGDEEPASHSENLAFCQGYCEDTDFHFYSGVTKLNYFVMTAEDFANHWRLQ